MRVGLLLVFQNFQDGITGAQAWAQDIRVAGLAEPLGFDTFSAAEHHFYKSPDGTQFLGYMPRRPSGSNS